MVDIHCHILPEVDDGAQSLAEALEMADMAVRCGVTDLVTTSHFHGEEENLALLDRIYRQFQRLEEALGHEQIPLRLHLGAEILCTHRTGKLAREQRLPTLGNTNYVLCEFYFDAPYDYMDRILVEITQAGYRPVVAHPERYHAIQQEPRRAQRWFRKGYVLQVNKGSLLGAFGPRVQAAARWMLDMGFVHVLASDAHSLRHRTTDLSQLENWLLDRYSPRCARLLLEENPGRLLRGEDMIPEDSF